MPALPLRFCLHDSSPGYAISAERVPLAVLHSFIKEVEDFLRGDLQELDTKALEVSLHPGAPLCVQAEPAVLPGLLGDLQLMLSTERVDALDTRRRTVVGRWQRQAHRSRLYRVEIHWAALERPVCISADSHYQGGDGDAWVQVERYVRGQIEELGGHKVVNAHVRLRDGHSLTVSTSKAVLGRERRNRLYKIALLRIRAEYNLRSRQYRNAELLEFVEHDPRIDSQDLQRLAHRGVQAWRRLAGAPCVWLDEQRGAAPFNP